MRAVNMRLATIWRRARQRGDGRDGSTLALINGMRIFLGLVVMFTVRVGFLADKKSVTPGTPASRVATASPAPRPVSEYDCAKHSLDRVSDVKKQVAQQQKDNAAE